MYLCRISTEWGINPKHVPVYFCLIFDRTGFRIENAYTHNGQITNPTERYALSLQALHNRIMLLIS